MYFDEGKTDKGIKRLRNYKKQRSTSLGKFMEKPKHDDNSHGADSFGYLCESLDKLIVSHTKKAKRKYTIYDPITMEERTIYK